MPSTIHITNPRTIKLTAIRTRFSRFLPIDFSKMNAGPAGQTKAHRVRVSVSSVFGGAATAKRYNLTLTASFRNAPNNVNPAPPIGNLSSPFFGRSVTRNTFGPPARRRTECGSRKPAHRIASEVDSLRRYGSAGAVDDTTSWGSQPAHKISIDNAISLLLDLRIAAAVDI